MNKIGTLSLLLVLACLFTGCGRGPKEKALPTVEMVYFYDSLCAACDTEEEFRTLLEAEIADLKPFATYTLRGVNLFTAGNEERDQFAKQHNIQDADAYTAMLVIGESVLLGDAIPENLRQFYWQAVGFGSSTQVTEYYYRDNCPDCEAVKAAVDTHLAKTGGPVVRISTVDTQVKNAFRTMLTSQKVPEERYQIPYLVENGKHYSGKEEILALVQQ